MKLLLSLSLVISATYSEGAKVREGPKKTFHPGNFNWGKLVRDANGRRVNLSNGLMGRPIGLANRTVALLNGNSTIPMHTLADGAVTIKKEDGSGYYYVSNDENGSAASPTGGVYVWEMNNEHNVVDFYKVLGGTADNCGGGDTPWGTFVSCEEETGYGKCWQVDPANKNQTGPTKSQVTVTAPYPSNWENFAWDDDEKKGYVTDDQYTTTGFGALARFHPDAAAMECYNKTTKEERWCTLNSGTHDYLKLIPGTGGTNEGTFEWVATKELANPSLYRNGEGMVIRDGTLVFTAKVDRLVFFLDLKKKTYAQYTTKCGDFTQEPDQIAMLGKTLYFANDGTFPCGVYGFHKKGGFYKIVSSQDYNTETSGIAFSPDNKYMYVAWQSAAVWQFWREDGYAFNEKAADIVYQNCPEWQLRGTKN